MDVHVEDNLQEQRDEVFALQEIFNTEDEEKLKVLSEVTDEKESLFTLHITVCPKPIQEAIQVNVIVPAEEEEDDVGGAAAAPTVDPRSGPPQLSRDVQLCRSMSGQRWQGSFEVKFLLPFNLLVTFPPTYPSSDPPKFLLSCAWMSPAQLEAIESMLQTLWSEAGNMPVVFTWMDWLENDCLMHLAIEDQLVLRSVAPVHGHQEQADLTSPEDDLGGIIAAMIRYNQEKVNEEFCQTTHLCEICYDEFPGTQFFRINECSHAFCHACMQAFCEMHTIAGTVEELRCPTQKCDSVMPPYIVQSVLSEEAYERWEKLMLQKTIDAMEDTVYCPRCGTVVIMEEDRESNLAHCIVCFFAFCTQCERGWHQGRDCETEEEMLENLERRAGNNLEGAVANRMRDLRRKLEDEINSKTLKKQSTVKCPSCKVHVEKIGGCNKMTCKCGKNFCWVCGNAITGYEHFRTGKCFLFPGQGPPVVVGPVRRVPNAVLRMQALREINPELANNNCRCPICKQENLKGLDCNNHIKCWNCKTNFCFLCKQRIVGVVSAHFKGPCSQHS